VSPQCSVLPPTRTTYKNPPLSPTSSLLRYRPCRVITLRLSPRSGPSGPCFLCAQHSLSRPRFPLSSKASDPALLSISAPSTAPPSRWLSGPMRQFHFKVLVLVPMVSPSRIPPGSPPPIAFELPQFPDTRDLSGFSRFRPFLSSAFYMQPDAFSRIPPPPSVRSYDQRSPSTSEQETRHSRT